MGTLKRWLLAAWAQAVHEAREGTALIQQMLEEELERLSKQCEDEAARARMLNEELEEEKSRRGSAWQLCFQCMEEAQHAADLLVIEQERARASWASPPRLKGTPVGGTKSPGAACIWP